MQKFNYECILGDAAWPRLCLTPICVHWHAVPFCELWRDGRPSFETTFAKWLGLHWKFVVLIGPREGAQNTQETSAWRLSDSLSRTTVVCRRPL